MSKTCIHVITVLFSFYGGYSQSSLGLMFGYVHDRSYSKMGSDIAFLLNPPVIDHRYTVLNQLKYSLGLNPGNDLLVSLRLTTRNFEYIYHGTSVHTFNHNTLEFPVGMRFKKTTKSKIGLHFDLEGGINLVLTLDRTTIGWEPNGTYFQFVNSRKPGYFIQPAISIDFPINETSSLSTFLAIQAQLTPLFRYKAYNTMFIFYSKGLYTTNINFGLCYRFSLRKRSEDYY